MNDYSQPTFYRFNLDSLTLVRRVLRTRTEAVSILDLGAGSGFLGIELARRLKTKKLTLVEAQEIYLPHVEKNRDFYLGRECECEIIIQTFGMWKPAQKYDLIVSNPPYFLPGRGEASKDHNRGIARTFILDDWGILFKLIDESLSAEGEAYLVVRSDKKIIETIRSALPQTLQMSEQVIDNIVYLDLSRLNKDGDKNTSKF